MATFDGYTYGDREQIDQPTNEAYGSRVENVPDIYEPGLERFGALNDTQPIAAQPQTVQAGNYGAAFGFLDFYNRIHFSERVIDLGNVVSVQQRELLVFNAYFVQRTLNDIVPTDDEGLTLTEPSPTPLIFEPLQELTYQLSVETEGPATIDATYLFDFDIADYDVQVVGVRIVAWSWEANWINNVTESLQWKTDVMQAYDGTEQRFQLKEFPRVVWEFTFDVNDDRRRLMENVLYAWGARIWALPVWVDIEHLTEALTVGATEIPLDSAGRDYHAGGIGVVIGNDGDYEAFEVDTVDTDRINLTRPLASGWPVGSRVYPARTARMMDPRGYGRHTRNYVRGLARFMTVEEIERTALDETLYRDLPVMERQPNWREAPEIDYARKLATIDFGTGKDFVLDESDLAMPASSFRWTILDRDEANYFRSWLYARRGRAQGFWLPTWSDDLILADTVTATQLNIDFAYVGLVHFALGDVHRRDIRIELIDGTIFYRRVINPVAVDEATERMTMNAPLDQLITPAQVERISWMNYVRLDTDSNEITWANAGMGEAMIMTRGPRNGF